MYQILSYKACIPARFLKNPLKNLPGKYGEGCF